MMGNIINGSDNAPDLSSSDEDETHPQEVKKSIHNIEVSRKKLDTDAVHVQTSFSRKQSVNQIDLISLKDVEKNSLDEYERVSLRFLLHVKYEDCLQNKSIHDWAKNESQQGKKWQVTFLEALSIIQNYEIPKKFGLSKIELNNQFFPLQYFTSEHVDLFRKIIFRICENLSKNEESIFLNHVEKDFRKRELEFRKFSYLELYFAYFLKIGYITENNVKNCKQIFKRMELDTVCEMLSFVHKESPVSCEKNEIPSTISMNITRDDTNSDRNNSMTENNVINFPHVTNDDIDNIYATKDNKKAFIIDQENFYTEYKDEFKHLLPEGIEKEKLKSRQGTFYDSERLKSTLEKRDFKVVVKRNLTHLKVIDKLKKTIETLDKQNCSLLLVAILSHGDKGVIYGSNSCHVEVSEIIEILSDKKLDDIPKVLILQSCQGKNLQTVFSPNDKLETDGLSIKAPEIKSRDFFIFWSTVPGFASIRDKQTGTWFIQSLCNQIDKYGDSEHFEDICTNVKREISKMNWEKNMNTKCFMVPKNESTLTKKLYL